jgi:hypothetical protein
MQDCFSICNPLALHRSRITSACGSADQLGGSKFLKLGFNLSNR